MTALLAVAFREFAAYFRTSIGWVCAALFLLICGAWIALVTLRPGEPATLREFFAVSHAMLLVVAPALSMRLYSEEYRSATIDTLMSSPLGDLSVALGKFLGACAFLVVLLLPTLAYPAMLELLADPEYGPIGAGYLGLFLTGVLYLAVGLFMSSLTHNQIVAFVGTLFLFVAAWTASDLGARHLPEPWSGAVLALSIPARAGDFAKGVIDTAHIVFFIAGSALFVVLSGLSVNTRRWR